MARKACGKIVTINGVEYDIWQATEQDAEQSQNNMPEYQLLAGYWYYGALDYDWSVESPYYEPHPTEASAIAAAKYRAKGGNPEDHITGLCPQCRTEAYDGDFCYNCGYAE
jgi:hypothetical protein